METTRQVGALVAALTLTGAATAVATGAQGSSQQRGPIIIGAAMDLTANMAPYDTPALYAVQLQVTKINATGGIGGRRLQVRVCDHQLKNQKTCALQLIQQGATVGMVTCDVEYAAPATQEFINKGMLTLAPCIGTDQQARSAWSKGTTGVHPRKHRARRGCGDGEYSIARGWKRAIIVKDNLLAYFQNVADLFKARYTELGGTVVQEEGFVVLQHDPERHQQGRAHEGGCDRVPDGVRRACALRRWAACARNDTPIINSWGGDGDHWWPQNRRFATTTT